MEKIIFLLGIETKIKNVKNINIRSNQSLMDADIVILFPNFSDYSTESSFEGISIIGGPSAYELEEQIVHWRKEIQNLLDYEKTIFIFLSDYEMRALRLGVSYKKYSNYNFLPFKLGDIHPASGTKIMKNKNLGALTEYWNKFGNDSEFKIYVENPTFDPLLKTKTNKIVGGILKVDNGTVILLPPISGLDIIDNRDQYGLETVDKTEEKCIIKLNEAIECFVDIDNAIKKNREKSPPPDWIKSENYQLKAEKKLKHELKRVDKEINSLIKKKDTLNKGLERETILRDLLFEKGYPLEEAIHEALKILGFNVERYQDNDSEFDMVFMSEEGRFLGEAEGKDTKMIDINKHSQLVRNIDEDFGRDGIEDYAKGVLFGNVDRLKSLEERGDYFTNKCIKDSGRKKTALVRTPDLFFVAKYVKENDDLDFAKKCREAISRTEGEIVKFPKISQ